MTNHTNTAAIDATTTESQMSRPLMTAQQAAERLGVSASTMEHLRGTGEGPAYVKISDKYVRYRQEDLDAFVLMNRRRSTAG